MDYSYAFRIVTVVSDCIRLYTDNVYLCHMGDRSCPECGETIVGRVDKRFCSDQCRAMANNKLNSDTTRQMRNINNILRRNRRILVELNPNDKTTVHKRILNEAGFNFNYYTNIYKTRTGKTYYFCYDQGYLPLDKEMFALVERKEYVK